MVIATSGLIEIADYNALALEINRLYSDTTFSLNYFTSNLILNATASPSGELAGSTWTLTSAIDANDFITVVIDNATTLKEDLEYVLTYSNPSSVTIAQPLAPNASIKVYNRITQLYGWGQQSSIYPISVGDPVLADESVLQAYLEANINNIIDKVNIIEERIGGPSQLTRVAPGNLILASDKLTIISTINNDILPGINYWNNTDVTSFGSIASFQRTTDWNNILVGEMRYTWNSYNDLRYYLNSGNVLVASVSMTGDPLEQGFNNWNQVVTRMGSLLLNYSDARQTGSGGFGEEIGCYKLTSTYQTVFTSGSPLDPINVGGDYDAYSSYADLIMVWEARILENTPAAGQMSIDIRVTMDDQGLNATTSGTTTFNGGYTIANDITDNSASFSVTDFIPTLTVLNGFETGDDS